MNLTNDIKTFIEKVASKALKDNETGITKEEYVQEYSSQVKEDDYLNFAAYAKSKNFKLPNSFGLDNLSSDEIYNMILYSNKTEV